MHSDALSAMPGVAHLYRDKYCTGNQISCARYKVYLQLGHEKVPADLYPHQHARLREILI